MDTKSQMSVRMSTYSKATTEASFSTFGAADSEHDMSALRNYSNYLDRLSNKQMQEQRYSVSNEKRDDMNKLALGAKVQRALDRRYSNQDAVFKPKTLSEKPPVKSA